MKPSFHCSKFLSYFGIVVLFLLLGNSDLHAQWMLINQNGGSPDSSAALELSDTTRGFLPTRLSTAQMDSIASPAAGLLVYNTDDSAFKYYDGLNWQSIGAGTWPTADSATIPAGSILPFAGDSSSIPQGFLLCDGLSVSTTTYAELFSAIGYAWGGSGGNFNVPDLRGRFLRGTAYGNGNDPDRASRTAINTGGNTGDEVGSVQGHQFASHNHTYTASDVVGFVTTSNYRTGNGTNARTGTVNNRGGNETRPINANVNFIICYNSALAAADSSTLAGVLNGQDLVTVLGNGNDAGTDSIVNLGAIGVGTSSPTELLDVAGMATLDSLNINSAYDLPSNPGANGQVLTTDGAGIASWSNLPAAGGVFEKVGGVIRDTTSDYSSDFVLGSPQLNDNTNAANDSRMIFDKGLGAFNVGIANGTEWDTRDTGSVVIGGKNNTASNIGTSVLGGKDNTASGTYATVLGGQNNTVNGNTSIAGGWDNSASGKTATAIGGYKDTASGDFAVALGGTGLYAPSAGEIAMGYWNTKYTPNSAVAINAADRLFVLGNGPNPGSRRNALTVYKSGNTTLRGELTLTDGTNPFTLPNADGTSNQLLTTNGAGVVSWQNPATGSSLSDADSDTRIEMDSAGVDTDSISFYTNGIRRMTINPDGNVGIGNTTPLAPLHFATDTVNRKIVLWQNPAQDNDHQFLGFGVNPAVLRYQIAGPTNAHVFYAGTSDSSSKELLRIGANGRIGIGTDTPSYKLDIKGTTGFADVSMRLNSVVTSSAPWLYFDKANTGETIVGNHNFGHLRGRGYDGTDYTGGASISFSADGVPAINDVPGRISFATTPAGSTSPVERMRIDNAGNVGIGTDSPVSLLHIHENTAAQANIRLSTVAMGASVNDGLILRINDATGARLTVKENNSLGFGTNNLLRMFIDSTGKVGIGTGSPTKLLTVGDGGGTPVIASSSTMFTANSANALSVLNTANSSEAFVYAGTANIRLGAATNHPMHLATNNVDRLTIDASGNVGIGTSSPLTKLHVEGGTDASLSGTSGFLVLGDTSTSNLVLDGNEIAARNNGLKSAFFLNAYGGDIHLGDGPVTGPALFVQDGGSVGVGITTPSRDLHVHDAATTGSYVQFTNSGTGTTSGDGSTIGQAVNDLLLWNYENGDIRMRTNNSERLRIEAGGNVGIGTSAPTYLLDVEANANAYLAEFQNNNATNGDGIRIGLGMAAPGGGNAFIRFDNSAGTLVGAVVGAGATSVSYNTTSDRRLKCEIQDFASGLELISSIQPRTYKWRIDAGDGQTDVGFIAQELQRIFPQAVTGDSTVSLDAVPMMVDYSKLVPVLTAGIKELHELVKEQKAFIDAQQSELDELKAERAGDVLEFEHGLAKQKALEQRLEALEKLLETGQVGKR